MKKIITSALVALLLVSCSDGIVPANPSPVATMPAVTTEETTAQTTAVPKEEPAEPIIFETAGEVVDYFNKTMQEAKQSFTELVPLSELPTLTRLMTEKSIEALTYTFGEIVPYNDVAATASFTVTYLDQAAIFDEYAAALTDEEGNVAPDENGEVLSEILASTDKIITEEHTLYIVFAENQWGLAEGSPNFIAYLPEALITIPIA